MVSVRTKLTCWMLFQGLSSCAEVCGICGKAFRGRNRRQNLSQHHLTHTGTRPFPCLHCTYRATQKAHLKRHCERVHGQQIENNPMDDQHAENSLMQIQTTKTMQMTCDTSTSFGLNVQNIYSPTYH